MAEYLIPKYKKEELEKKINRIRNKGAQVTFNVLEEDIPVPYEYNGRTRHILCDKIEVEGEYKINGWKFIATIEHASPNNIIRLIDPSLENWVPARYWTAGRECEHCHIRRDRNDTYLVYNEDEDEFKQVGKTCLQSYTNGLNAETCSALASVTHELAKLDDASHRGDFDFESIPSSHYVMPMEEAKKKAYKYVEDHGYISGETGHAFVHELFNGDEPLPEASDEEIANVQQYLENAENSFYTQNALAAWTKRAFEPRDGGLITSAVFSYFKYIQKQTQQQARAAARQAELANINQTAAGAVGDKIDFTVQDSRVLYMKQSGNYYGDEYPVYRIVGSDGRIYIWACSNGTQLTPAYS